MAKSIYLLLILFGGFILIHHGVDRIHLKQTPQEVHNVEMQIECLPVDTIERVWDDTVRGVVQLEQIRAQTVAFLKDRDSIITLPKNELLRDRLQTIYTNEIGVREATNKNDGKRVAEYLRYTNLAEGYAWCASYVSFCYGEVGLKEPKTAWTPSLFPRKRVIWKRNGEVSSKNKDAVLPKRGDVFGIYFTSYKRIAHAGFVDEWGDKYVVTVEGNTNESGSREGDGVYRKRRLISSIYQVANWVDPIKI